ncbi:hypothetical protein [Pedobacter steynii]|uniref:Uncharacterized protein n=1 Tax=Pedobacter steynii TaxID=430522 RepID=A0A1D7QFF5_9SPHI|nr:hypothetical protein [Pedobacter steynii]AOM77377.1 hypothetical protein BFS30_09490 [Pedobacter steynii]
MILLTPFSIANKKRFDHGKLVVELGTRRQWINAIIASEFKPDVIASLVNLLSRSLPKMYKSIYAGEASPVYKSLAGVEIRNALPTTFLAIRFK